SAGLQLTGGTVVLLADFQGGGAITNLTLDGATLNGTNAITGVLRWRSGTIGGVLTVENGGQFLIEGTGAKTLSATTTNRGTMQLSGTGDVILSGSLDNEGLLE